MSIRRIYGIDLGTTYSCIARVDEAGKPLILTNAQGEAITPSVAYFEEPGQAVVGQDAKKMVRVHPERCVPMVKREMGDPYWRREIFGRSYSPQEVSALVLRKLVEDVRQVHGETVEEVVITCPAYFGVNEREATRQAGTLAGLDVRYVIPEPTAAAFAYEVDRSEPQAVLVYDLGGGTFDVTVIEITEREIRVVCTGGDHQLGGANWDEEIASFLAHRYGEELGLPADELLADEAVYQDLLRSAEGGKKILSDCRSATEEVHYDGEAVRVELDRATFERLTAHHLGRTLDVVDDQITTAREKGVQQIDRLILVGGSTLMPQVLEALQGRYAFPVERFDPHEAVAKGAALFGFEGLAEDGAARRPAVGWADSSAGEEEPAPSARSAGRLTGRSVHNVSAKSLGVVIRNARDETVVCRLIDVNDPVPREATQRFSTYVDEQREAELVCMESAVRNTEEIDPGLCSELGRAVLVFGRPLPRDTPIEITFSLSADGLLTVKGAEPATGSTVEARFVTEGVLGPAEELEARMRTLKTRIQ